MIVQRKYPENRNFWWKILIPTVMASLFTIWLIAEWIKDIERQEAEHKQLHMDHPDIPYTPLR